MTDLNKLSRPEGVLMAKKPIRTAEELTGVKLGSHSPKASMQILLESYLRQHPASKPTIPTSRRIARSPRSGTALARARRSVSTSAGGTPRRTSTELAPWKLVSANDKYHARIEVLRTLSDAIEAAL